MSQKRREAQFERSGDGRSQITTFTRDYAAGHRVRWHFHDRDQLLYASRGVMTVRTEEGAWVVPTYRAVWIPARVAHSIAMSGSVAMRALYLKPRLASGLPRICCVVNVSPLLKELLLHTCGFAALARRIPWQRRRASGGARRTQRGNNPGARAGRRRRSPRAWQRRRAPPAVSRLGVGSRQGLATALKYARGVRPSAFLNMAMKALGVL